MQVERPAFLNLQLARHKDEQVIQEHSPEGRPALETGGVNAGDCDLLKPGTFQQYRHRQQQQQKQTVCANQLSPNLQPSSPVSCVPPVNKQFSASLVGDKYLMLEVLEGSTLHRCVNVHTQQEYVCKVSVTILISHSPFHYPDFKIFYIPLFWNNRF